MSSPKGYPTQEKIGEAQFSTVQPLDGSKYGQDVHASLYVRLVGSDAVEANSTAEAINATSHAAKKGDIIRITSGALDEERVRVLDVDTNIIYITPLSAVPANGVTFEILRHINPRVDAEGDVQVTATVDPAPISFVLDGNETEVEEDTGTPGNSTPLPVKVLDSSGLEADFATEAKQDTQITHLDAIETAVESIAAEDFATETTLAALNAKVTAVNTDAVTISAALPAGNNNIGDVDVASLPSIPAGTNNIGDVDVLTLPSIPAGTNNIGDVDVVSLPTAGTATSSNVSGSASNVTLLSSNASRKGATIFNDSSSILYVKLGTTASTTSYTVQLPQNAYYEVPYSYTGNIDGIWASATGAARIVELT